MIEIQGCVKTYRSKHGDGIAALGGVDLTIKDHEFVCLLGPSGCGKTTLLKIVAGLTSADAGQVLIGGRPVEGPGPDRSVVFQNFALLPWADVLSNVQFGLEMRGVHPSLRRERALHWIQSVGLSGFESRFPRELSGGMQQRVGLARALAVDPQILLMDEPFTSVDSQTRRLLQDDLVALHQKERKTVMFVTHSMDEAVRLADRVVLLTERPGRVLERLDVPLPRPRPAEIRKCPEFSELTEYLWSRIQTMQPDLRSRISERPEEELDK